MLRLCGRNTTVFPSQTVPRPYTSQTLPTPIPTPQHSTSKPTHPNPIPVHLAKSTNFLHHQKNLRPWHSQNPAFHFPYPPVPHNPVTGLRLDDAGISARVIPRPTLFIIYPYAGNGSQITFGVHDSLRVVILSAEDYSGVMGRGV